MQNKLRKKSDILLKICSKFSLKICQVRLGSANSVWIKISYYIDLLRMSKKNI